MNKECDCHVIALDGKGNEHKIRVVCGVWTETENEEIGLCIKCGGIVKLIRV